MLLSSPLLTHRVAGVQTVRVRRIFDEKHKTLLYIAYSTRLGGGVSIYCPAIGKLKFYCEQIHVHSNCLTPGFVLDDLCFACLDEASLCLLITCMQKHAWPLTAAVLHTE